MLLLDSGVWVGAADVRDPFHESARALIFDDSQPLAAMDLTFYEVANVLGIRKGQPRKARYMTELIAKRCEGESLVAADPGLMDLATSMAKEHHLTAYDAAYAAAAVSNGWTLVSADIADLVSKDLAVTPDAAVYP
jgi:predicted nucleic acid-binding protein